jgi:hypothetical protein
VFEPLTSWWVDSEVGTAFDKEQQLTRERGEKVRVLIPLNLDGYLFSDKCKSAFTARIRRRVAADFTSWESNEVKFKEQREGLIQALRAD